MTTIFLEKSVRRYLDVCISYLILYEDGDDRDVFNITSLLRPRG